LCSPGSLLLRFLAHLHATRARPGTHTLAFPLLLVLSLLALAILK